MDGRRRAGKVAWIARVCVEFSQGMIGEVLSNGSNFLQHLALEVACWKWDELEGEALLPSGIRFVCAARSMQDALCIAR